MTAHATNSLQDLRRGAISDVGLEKSRRGDVFASYVTQDWIWSAILVSMSDGFFREENRKSGNLKRTFFVYAPIKLFNEIMAVQLVECSIRRTSQTGKLRET